MTEFDVYWILKLDSIRALLIAAGLMLVWVCIVSHTLCGAMSKSWCIFGMSFGVILLITGVMVPTTKEICAIKVIPKVVNSQEFATIKKDLGEVYTLGMEHIKTTLSNKEEK